MSQEIAPRPDDEQDAWRSRVARRLALVALALNAVGTAFAVTMQTGHGREGVAGGGVLASILLALALRRRASERARAWLVVSAFSITFVAGYSTLGFMGGPAAALVTTVVVAGLLLGRRALAAVLILSMVVVAFIGTAMVNGWLPAPAAADSSPLSPRAWVRTVGMASLLAGLGGLVVTWVVAQLEASLDRVRLESRARLAAEQGRREAEHLAAESQKLELVGRLAAGLAHDFNNHLTVISMAHGRLADARVPEDQRHAASKAIADSIRNAGTLSRQLLVLGRSAPRELKHLSLRAVVDAFLPSVERVLPSDVALEVSHEEPVTVHADESQLQQALLNFVVNARDAMPGGGTLVVRTRRASLDAPRRLARGTLAPGAWGVLEVEDSGTGIDPAVRDRVFEPFFTTKPLDKGSGLGLSTVAMIAAEAGGHVELDTAAGKGTRIALWLPAVAAITSEIAPSSTPPPTAETSLEGSVVLVVEDEPLLLDAAARVLGDAGCRVITARDGTEAVTRIAEHEGAIDLLCADVVMPGTPVREVIARFRAAHPESPVLTCSGYVGEDLVRRGIEDGRYKLLQKPYVAEQLLSTVAELLRTSRPRTSDRKQVG